MRKLFTKQNSLIKTLLKIFCQAERMKPFMKHLTQIRLYHRKWLLFNSKTITLKLSRTPNEQNKLEVKTKT